MFIVMPNDHLAYIAYNSASVWFFYFTLQAKKMFNFRFQKRSKIMQVPPYTM